uniref:Uncharacterized protein n=1 Tax=Panagrolaimus davidi TaxID=227884 RepID=A0A914R364_9BILA
MANLIKNVTVVRAVKQNKPRNEWKKRGKYAKGTYMYKSHFAFTLFGKQMDMMHQIAADMSKVFTNRKWNKYQKWTEINHMINGTKITEKGKSSET